jgi:enolase
VTTTIAAVHGRRVWDSRGRPTVEVELMLSDDSGGRAIAPAGASTGSGEAVDLRDGGRRLGGLDVSQALAAVEGEIARALVGMRADQRAVDERLVALDGTPNRARLGGNALVATSMALAHARAAEMGVPLWMYLLAADLVLEDDVLLPLPEIQIYGGGAHAAGRVDLQDFMVMPLAASSFAEACEWIAEIYRVAGERLAASGRRQGVADEGGWWPAFDSNEQVIEELVRAIEQAGYVPGEQVGISLDIAATQFHHNGRYKLRVEDAEYDSDAWCARLLRWLERYPIVSIEDPVAESDEAGMVAFTRAAGKVQIIGDDFLTTSAARVRHASSIGACNAVLLKPNQAGTLSETRDAWDAARTAGWAGIVSARSGETEDVTIVHLAIGWKTGQLKVGSFARSERMAKWNEVIRIEEVLGARAKFAGRSALAPLPSPTQRVRKG